MTLMSFMFSSPYDQAALVIMAIGLVINAMIDIARARAARRARKVRP